MGNAAGLKAWQVLANAERAVAIELLAGITVLILGCADVSTNDATLIAAFVMSTWFIESLPIAPYLALVGLPRSGKTTLLQVLNLLCRRPLLTADITSAAFYEVYEKLSPTSWWTRRSLLGTGANFFIS